MIPDEPDPEFTTGPTVSELRSVAARFTDDEIACVTDVGWRGRAIGGDFDSDDDRQLWERWYRHIHDTRASGWRYLVGRAVSAAAAATLIAAVATSGREWLLSLTP
ncbi:hypothetical protein AB4Z09_28085 [Rhodococcus sp. TAF43]|uniref:hypothetical protein n=1 Tax=Rhodococcus sp. TAF43 TaxID=3237483 RepID=UPI003F95BE7A